MAPSTATRVEVLGSGARSRRALAVLLVGAVLVGGSAVGSDDWFPLGPFRMYTNRAEPSGRVRVITLEAIDADGQARSVRPGDVGLRHAELEGQLRRFEGDPALLSAVAGAYASVHPQRSPLIRIDLRERVRLLVDNVLADEVEERTIAEWVAP